MSNPSRRPGKPGRTHSRPSPVMGADNADRALADIRAWTQLLVARGNRLLELAVRERQEIAREQGSMRFEVRDAAPAAAKAGERRQRTGRKQATLHTRPLA